MPCFIDDYLKIPLSCVAKIDKTTALDKKSSKICYLELFTKDMRQLKFHFESIDDCNNAVLRMQLMAFPENEMHDIFTFSFFYPMQDPEKEYLENGWDIYKNPKEEFIRQGIDFAQVILSS